MMTPQAKENKYKGIEYSYSIEGENQEYGGTAWIHLHFGDASQDIQLVLYVNFDTPDKAREALIRSIQSWIDNH